jgi:hypothetical protein
VLFIAQHPGCSVPGSHSILVLFQDRTHRFFCLSIFVPFASFVVKSFPRGSAPLRLRIKNPLRGSRSALSSTPRSLRAQRFFVEWVLTHHPLPQKSQRAQRYCWGVNSPLTFLSQLSRDVLNGAKLSSLQALFANDLQVSHNPMGSLTTPSAMIVSSPKVLNWDELIGQKTVVIRKTRRKEVVPECQMG